MNIILSNNSNVPIYEQIEKVIIVMYQFMNK